MLLPEIPQAKPSHRLLKWARERKRALAGVAGALLLLLLFLSLVPLPDDEAPGGKTTMLRAALSAVPRWAGVKMERSHPESMVQGSLSQEAGAGPRPGGSRVSTRGYDVARGPRREPGQEAEEEHAPSAAKAAAFAMIKRPDAGPGPSGLQAGGGEPAAAAAEASPLRAAGLASGRAAPAPSRPGRRSGLAGGSLGGGRAGGRFGALAAPGAQAAGSAGSKGALGNPPLPVTPIAPVPAVPKGVSRFGEGSGSGSGGGGGGGEGPGRAAASKHRCAQVVGDAASLRCRAADCMLEEIRAAYTPLLAVTMAAHGVRPPGAEGGGGGDLLGGMIEEGGKGAADFAAKADALKNETSQWAFQCAQPGACDDLATCRDFVVDQLGRAAATMRESAAAFSGAREPCRSLPGGSGDTGCTAKLKLAAGKDRQAAERVRRALQTARGEGTTQCRSSDAAQQKRWDDYRNALVGKLKPVLTAIEKPYCPDRLPCEPRGESLLDDARRKLDEVSRGVPDVAELGGLPGETAGAFLGALQDLNIALPLLKSYNDSSSVNLFDAIARVDSAAARVGPAADAWGAAKAKACGD